MPTLEFSEGFQLASWRDMQELSGDVQKIGERCFFLMLPRWAACGRATG